MTVDPSDPDTFEDPQPDAPDPEAPEEDSAEQQAAVRRTRPTRRSRPASSHRMRTITGRTHRFAAWAEVSAASAAARSVKFCVRAARTRVTQKYDGPTAQRARCDCVRTRFWEAA